MEIRNPNSAIRNQQTMLLAIDTATRMASVALYDETGVQGETTWRTNDNHTRELMPAIAQRLAICRLTARDLKAIGVATGPGSFTGLRVGLSLAKGLASTLAIPLLGIPTLDAVVAAHLPSPPLRSEDLRQTHSTWAILSAGRGRYATALYTTHGDTFKRAGDYHLANVEQLAEIIARNLAADGRVFLAGEIDAALEMKLQEHLGARAVLASPAQRVRRAGFLAALAWARWTRGESDDVASLTPYYIPTASMPV
jgi:tRNA threonylcarbamoyladenosine biosynthesis protein TsaB